MVESAVLLPALLELLDLLQAGSTTIARQSPTIMVAMNGDILNFMCNDFKVYIN